MKHPINPKQSTIDKLRSVTDHTKIGMLHTRHGEGGHAFPMTTQEVDDNGTLWFFSSSTTQHYEDLCLNGRAELTYCNESKSEYLHLQGHVHMVNDQKRIEELWSPLIESWYEGKYDPTIVLYQFLADEIYTWENQNGKIVAFFNMLRTAINGDPSNVVRD